MSNPMDHVQDSYHWHFLDSFPGIHLPTLDTATLGTVGLSKFMILQVIAVVLIFWIYTGLAKRIKNGEPARGAFWNFWEVLLTFIRDEVAKPNIQPGHHHDDHGHAGHDDPVHDGHEGHDHHEDPAAFADRYVPFLWTMFLFILFNNLLGMIPFLGSATGSFTVTCVLAAITFFFIHGSAVARHGVAGYVKSYIPTVEAPLAIKALLVPMIFVIEIISQFIKCFVLSVRLFANIFAGHLVLAFIMSFIVLVKNSLLFYVVTPASIGGVVALSLLELFVAFLQAFVFTYLTAIFVGQVLAPEH
jgi:F-type H+-transporting ATPase subunit a